jgi:hypothetical protein
VSQDQLCKNATSGLVRFITKILYFRLINALGYYNADVVVINSEMEGLAPCSYFGECPPFGENTIPNAFKKGITFLKFLLIKSSI